MRVTSPWGDRVSPLTGKVTFHNGVDFGVAEGTVLQAADAGVVEFVLLNLDPVVNPSGRAIGIRRDDGVSFSYAHMSAIDVTTGMRVTAGQRLGLSGKTGAVTGPHLHFVVRGLDGKSVDPMPMLPAAGALPIVIIVAGVGLGVWLLSRFL